MHDARGIANFFLDRAERQGVKLTTMTLLKVLFFAHAWHLAKEGKPLIAQPFEAWEYGPVSRIVYDQFKSNGKEPISKRAVSFDAKQSCFCDTPYLLDGQTEIFLNNIFDYYSQFDAFKLSDLTHEKGSPWDVVWSAAATRAVPGMYIPNELIASWFREQREVYWT
ncbi:MAG TPA: type II toxin-antitoxin system antitoxin SocA domain-containing protein [Xanthobacteraceae bacterium]|jgi:uncharacterized phage-associated protein|nr:type II toxin-antitoxin system antitoxin SocA domain-containing protein [Xanthobacteraceae bacterium]